jgi:hypothetical protein
LLAALRDFVEHSEFDTFFKKRSRFYTDIAAEAHKGTIALAAELETERRKGAPLHLAGITLAPLLAQSSAVACQPDADERPEAWLVLGVRDGVARAVGKPAALKKALAHRPHSDCQSLIASALPNSGPAPGRDLEKKAKSGEAGRRPGPVKSGPAPSKTQRDASPFVVPVSASR